MIRRDVRSAPFFDGAARGTLMIRRCGACGTHLAPESGSCPCGGDDPAWVAAAGTGTLISFAGPQRSLLAIVELAEGPWLYGGLADVAEPRAGMPLRVVFVHPDEGESYPIWEARDANAGV